MKFHCINLYDEVPLHEINPVQKKKNHGINYQKISLS